jgi:4-hydroxymandelate oxidase
MQKDSNKLNAGDSNLINRDYLDSLLIETRYVNSIVADTTLTLFGEAFRTPIMTAAFSHLDKIYKDSRNGMVEMAKGAYDANAIMWAGMGDEEELRAMTGTGARVIKIIKPYADESLIFQQIKDAEKYGALAVGMDIDHSFDARGKNDNVLGVEMSPKTVGALRTYVSATHLPFIIKGVLSVQDAHRCLEAGVQGIVVSHHHGITDYAIPPLMVLPRIVQLVNGAFPIFVDCGIERGFDAFKALALGATAVSVGRVIIADLIKDGYQGVSRKITEMNDELAGAMSRTGSANIKAIDSDVIWPRP